MFLIFLLSLMIASILIFINSLIAKKMWFDREKASPFECGFDPASSSRIPFSLRFYLISLIFLIFDVEITLIMPMPMIIKMNSLLIFNLMSATFTIILILGLVHEWNQGALEWDS